MANLHPSHSPYSVQLRERVVYKRVVEHQSYAQISEGFGGNPCIETVEVICQDFTRAGGRVLAKQGREGIVHENRKFDVLAWELLVDAVESSPQLLLKDLASLMSFRLGEQWSEPDVSKVLKSAGFVRKVVFNLAAEARPELQAKYRQLCELRGHVAANYGRPGHMEPLFPCLRTGHFSCRWLCPRSSA